VSCQTGFSIGQHLIFYGVRRRDYDVVAYFLLLQHRCYRANVATTGDRITEEALHACAGALKAMQEKRWAAQKGMGVTSHALK
jgi:hypothetical protein